MKNVKNILKWMPEIYLICSVIYYWIGTALLFNPIAIAFIFVLILQLMVRNKIIGILISGLFVIINLYLVLALLSELKEFPEFNSSAKMLLFFGSIYMGLNITMGIMMFIKYIKPNKQKVVPVAV